MSVKTRMVRLLESHALTEASWVDQAGMNLVALVGQHLQTKKVVDDYRKGSVYDAISYVVAKAVAEDEDFRRAILAAVEKGRGGDSVMDKLKKDIAAW